MDESLAAELIEMAKADQAAFDGLERACAQSQSLRARIEARSTGSTSPAWPVEWTDDPPDPIIDIQRVVRSNTDRLRRIVQERGWPGRLLVGDEAATAAWLLVHHAQDLAFQRACLPLLSRAVEAGDATRTQLEWLTDRVLLREGKEERFGTHSGDHGDPPLAPLSQP
jgi:hypothetical protein